MKIPTFKNIDHSGGVVVGEIITTHTNPSGSTENIERLLSDIYKDLINRNPTIEINVPEILVPKIDMPEIKVVTEGQPVIHIENNPQNVSVNVVFPKNFIVVMMSIGIFSLAVSALSLLLNILYILRKI